MIGIKEIAKESGVSKTTVSFVLNGRHKRGMRISETVASRVLSTASRLGYVRNELVQSMVCGKSRVIAIIGEFSDFMMTIIRGYSDTAADCGYSIRLISVNGDINKALHKALACRADGIAAMSLSTEVKNR